PPPVTITQIACVGSMDGIALSKNPANATKPFLFTNDNDGTVVKIDQVPSPPVKTTIVSGGTRGDFVTVGPDGCLYATQSRTIERVTSADGTCPWTAAPVIPQLFLRPSGVAP